MECKRRAKSESYFMKKLTVSIGIPAFNEEANIKKLLTSLLGQEGSNFTLQEIIVVSDGSTDNTTTEVKNIKDKRVKLVQNKKRLGQASGQNKIIKLFKGEILVLLNADVLPIGKDFISKIVLPFQSYDNLGLVGPKIIPLKSKTFFENVLNYSVSFKDSIFEKWHKGDNLYMCRGGARAFRKDLAKKTYWDESLSEDAYSYLLCKKLGYEFKYYPPAKVNFKSPDNFEDHMRQSARFVSGPDIMSKYFEKDLVMSEYAIPKRIAIQTMIEYFLKSPVLFLSYIATFFIIKINPNNKKFANSKWQISKSSKVLTQ